MDPPTTFPLAYREDQAYPISVTEGAPVSKPSDLLQGTLDFLILKILALEPLNGWAISQRLTQVSGDVLQVSDGSLYPALHKLEQEGWISSEWKPSENNPAPSSTRSLVLAVSNSIRNPPTGTASPPQLRTSCD